MSPRPTQTVLLLHCLEDGSSHFDWLIETHPDADLLTFRIDHPLSRLGVGSQLLGLRLGDHRRKYLTYEGPISDNRGMVRQVARGTAVLSGWPGNVHIQVAWEDISLPQLWLGQPVEAGTSELWSFVSLPVAP